MNQYENVEEKLAQQIGVTLMEDLLPNLLAALPLLTEQFGSGFQETAVLTALESTVTESLIQSTSRLHQILMSGFGDSSQITNKADKERLIANMILRLHPKVRGHYWVTKKGNRAALRVQLERKLKE